MQSKKNEILVGLFMLMAFGALIFIGLRVADFSTLGTHPTYRIYADFDNIGGLKSDSPVKIGGVVVGRVATIELNKQTFVPRVAIDMDKEYDSIPDTSSLAIRTSGLLGEQYLALNVGFYDEDMGTDMLSDGTVILDTKSAMVLEDMIGQFLYNSGSKSDETKTVETKNEVN